MDSGDGVGWRGWVSVGIGGNRRKDRKACSLAGLPRYCKERMGVQPITALDIASLHESSMTDDALGAGAGKGSQSKPPFHNRIGYRTPHAACCCRMLDAGFAMDAA